MTREILPTPAGPLDSGERRAAAWELDRNIVVEAGAGTGKTSLLVERALAALVARGHPAERLTAITFTEKAAAEMRERLTAALEDLIALAAGGGKEGQKRRGEAVRAFEHLTALAPQPERLKADLVASRAHAALEKLDEASIGTIHALASEILRRHPRESGTDPVFTVDEGSKLRRLVDRSWPEFLAGELGRSAPRRGLWRDLLARFEVPSLRPLAGRLAEHTAPLGMAAPAPEARSPLVRLARVTAGPLRDLLLLKLNPRPEQWIRSAIDLLDRLEKEGPQGLRSGNSREALQDVLDRIATLGKKFDGDAEAAAKAMNAARDLIREAAKVDPAAIALLTEALAPFGRTLREASLEEGFVTFDGLLLLARNLLRDHPDVRAEEKDRAGLLLVDEFQDTDPLQYEIVLYLAERSDVLPAADAFKALLEPGKLFIVGDPRQSIYRFRGADIAAFGRSVRRVVDQGARHCRLTVNFRSVPEILDPLDGLFRGAFGPGDPPVQPAHEPITAYRGPSGAPSARVTVLSVAPADGDVRAEGQRLREGRAIAAELIAERDAGRSWSGMALLLPAMTTAPLFTRALHDAGIPFVIEGGRVFGAKPETRVLLSILSAIADSRDAIAFLAVARSPLGAVSDAELARYAANDGRLPPRSGQDGDLDSYPGLARTRRILDGLRERTRKGRVDEVIECVIADTPMLPLAALAWGGAQAVANLRTLAVRAAGLARDEGLSLEAVVETLREELEEQDRGETPLADDRLDAVRVLTVHKAKGLEFDVVVVGDLRRGSGRGGDARERRAACTIWRDPVSGVEEAAVAIGRGRRETISEAEALRRLSERAHGEAERIRLFYVACTRARERLILVQSDPKGGGDWTRLLGAWGYECTGDGFPAAGALAGGAVEHRIVEDTRSATPRRDADDDRLEGALGGFDRARAQARASDHPWIWSPTGRRVAKEGGKGFPSGIGEMTERRLGDLDEAEPWAAPGDDQPGSPAAVSETVAPDEGEWGGNDVARAAGTAVHALLEAWDLHEPAWLTRRAAAYATREAQARAIDPRPVIHEVDRILEGFVASPLPERLASVEIVGREVPFFSPSRTAGRDAGTTDPENLREGERTAAPWSSRDGSGGTHRENMPATPALMQGIADLLYREKDGTMVVADYKTDIVTGGEVERIARHYAPQMGAYARALRESLPAGTPVRAELWLARTGEIVKIGTT